MSNSPDRINAVNDAVTEAYLRIVGSNLKKWRLHRKLSLRDLAYITNIDNSKIAKIEKGQINVTLVIFKRLLVGLDVNEHDFFGLCEDSI